MVRTVSRRRRCIWRAGWGVLVWVSICGLDPGGAHAMAPEPTEEYRVWVYDTEGNPVPGVTVRVHEDARRKLCGDAMCTCPASVFPRSKTAVSDASGQAVAVFDYPTCEYVSSDPHVYETIGHAGWLGVDLPPTTSTGQAQPWVMAVSNATEIYITQESELAHRFAPVLHAHAGTNSPMERQEGVAHPNEVLADGWGSVELFNVLGARVYGPSQSWHGFDDDHGLWDTCGHNASPFFGRLDIDDGRWHSATSTRPVFYHVFPYEDGVVIQYWYFFLSNDTREMWGQGFHEGDWEHIALKVRYENGEWVPSDVNFYVHEGGERRDPAECWWSATNDPTYEGLLQGFESSRTHLHVWISANSHSSYNRFAETYTLDVDGPGGCDVRVWDHCDYNLSGNPRGEHAFFEYDALVDMGEVVAGEDAHGFEWQVHYDGGIEFNRYMGHFGRGSSASCPSGCPSIVCLLMMDLASVFSGGVPSSYGPLAPSMGSTHEWSYVHDDPGEFRWGNDVSGGPGVEVSVEWEAHAPDRQYLGSYRMCAAGNGDPLTFRVRGQDYAGTPRLARVTVVEGTVELLGAAETCGTVCGLYTLSAMGAEEYELTIPAMEGDGRVQIDVYPEGASTYDAYGLEADIEDCATSGHAGSPGVAGVSLRVFPMPMTGSVQISWNANKASGLAEEKADAIEIFDVLGRRVRRFLVEQGQTLVRWDGRSEDGSLVSDGIYLVSLLRGGQVVGSAKAVRTTVR